MMDTLVRAIAGPVYRQFLRRAFREQRFGRTNERPVEYAFTLRALNDAQPQRVLDVGSGRSAFPALLRTCGFVVTATDNIRDYWPRGMFNHHWHVVDDDILASRLPPASFDAVTCISVLEHITRPVAAVAGMHRLLRAGGHLVLTTPFGSVSHENVYTLPDSYGAQNPYPCRQSSPADLDEWLTLGFHLQAAEYWQFFQESSYWSCGPLMRPPRQTRSPAQLGCFVLQRANGPAA